MEYHTTPTAQYGFIKEHRKKHGITQAKIAELVGIRGRNHFRF